MVDGKGIIFVFEDIRAKEYIESIKTKKDPILICGNDGIKRKLIDLGYECKSINEYSVDAYDDIKKATEWMKSWPDKPILKAKSFKELLVYEGFSIFWFLETRFYVYRIQGLIPLIEQIKNVFSAIKPDNVWVIGSNDVKHIVRQLCVKNQQKFEYLGGTISQTQTAYKSYSKFLTLKLVLLKLFRGLSLLLSESNNKKNSILVITELGNWRNEYDYTLKKIIKKDVIFHDIVKKILAQSLPVKIIDFENEPKRLFNAYSANKERRKSFGIPVNPWEKYITLGIIRKSKVVNKKLMKLLDKLLNSKEFKESLIYDGISIYEILKKDIEDLFKSFKTYTAITFIETTKRIIEIEKPSVILMHDEYGALQLSLINEAKKRKIPTVSIQHGVNTESWISYVHKKDHVSGKNANLNFPLPDKMCVWSENAKKNLIKFGNFPESVSIVTGDPKVDFLPIALKQFDNNTIRQTLKIPPNKKIILFATQKLPNIEEKKIITKNVMDAAKILQDYYFLLKMHPNETDFTFYRNLTKESGIKNISIVQNFNLYELFHISDVVIVAYSTVGVEAMRMKKPVIALNLLGLHDDDPIIKNEKAIIVRNQNELVPSIKKCLETQTIDKMIDSAFISAEQEIGVVNGNAADLIANLVIELKKGEY